MTWAQRFVVGSILMAAAMALFSLWLYVTGMRLVLAPSIQSNESLDEALFLRQAANETWEFSVLPFDK